MNNVRKGIFIVDDHQVVIDSVCLLLRDIPQFEITGSTTEPLLAPGLIANTKTDILITDVSMPGMNGIELTKVVRSKFPHIKIIALSMFGDRRVIAEMIDAGISGYLLKNTSKIEIEMALGKISLGSPYFSLEILTLMA